MLVPSAETDFVGDFIFTFTLTDYSVGNAISSPLRFSSIEQQPVYQNYWSVIKNRLKYPNMEESSHSLTISFSFGIVLHYLKM